MRKLIYLLLFVVLALNLASSARALAMEATASATPIVTPSPVPASDFTQKTLESQPLGSVWPGNPIKHAIRGAVAAGVPANTIVLLLLLPIMTFVIAFSRNVVGIRGFGIFLPAALSVVFVATGPIIGIGLFLIIVAVSTIVRLTLRKLNIKLQYLPRMSFILWAVVIGVLGILFLAPVLKFPALSNVSIFAVLILVLLSEDFTRVQLGKSIRTALNLTFETLLLSLISFFFLTLKPLQGFVLLNPEISLIGIAALDLLLGQYTGLRVMEFYRFRKLINQ
jgi:hypothetical protein